MGKTKLIIIGVIILIVGLIVGALIAHGQNNRKYRPQIISYQAQIDSLRFRLDTALMHIDFDYVPEERIIVQTKYKYIIKKIENEKHKYFALDTSDRVKYFRDRVRARTGQ